MVQKPPDKSRMQDSINYNISQMRYKVEFFTRLDIEATDIVVHFKWVWSGTLALPKVMANSQLYFKNEMSYEVRFLRVVKYS